MKKKHLRVIEEIQSRIPKDLLSKLMKEELESPAMKKVLEHALSDPNTKLEPRQRRRMQAALDSGMLDRKVQILDPVIEKQIDDFMTTEIALAVKLGRLPKVAPQLELIKNKGKNYARKQEKRLRREFLGEVEDVVPYTSDDQKDKAEHSPRTNDGGILLEPGGSSGNN